MQPSMFNVRVPLEDQNEVFLMNTFTDAQLIVSTDVAALLDELEHRDAAGWTSEERDAIGTLAEHGFIVESRDADRDNLQRFFHEVRESREQLRMTVLTTLQCNFACDYCIQGDHGDYNKHAAKMSLETAARVGDWAEQRLEALRPESYVLTFFGGEPLLNLPVMYYLAERHVEGLRRARRPHAHQHHHQRPAADPGDRRSAERLRPERHQDHARRRSRHAQQDAAAARRPGHLRQDRPQRPAGRAQDADRHRRQLRHGDRRQLSGAARLPQGAGLRRQAVEGGVQADHPRTQGAAGAGRGLSGQGLEVHRADRGQPTSRWAARA